MSSLFGKVPSEPPKPSAYARERIEGEISHLQKKASTRHGPEERKAKVASFLTLVFFIFFILYAWDPIVFSWRKGDAINAYLYIHQFGSEAKARALIDCGILTPNEALTLDHRQGSFRDYYVNALDAEQKVDTIVAYMKSVHDLHNGHPESLDALGKVRYALFYSTGLGTPIQWDILNPKISEN